MKLITGDVVKYLRKMVGMGQQTLAKKVNVTQSMISRIERGQKEISPHLQNRLVEAFGISEAEIIAIWSHVQALKKFEEKFK